MLIVLVELGGTVGDIESAPFIEAMSQLQRRAGQHNFLQIHVSYTPLIGSEQSMSLGHGFGRARANECRDKANAKGHQRCPQCWSPA